MDKIGKALGRLRPKEREQVKNILERLSSEGGGGLDVKKLKGRNDIFRVRKGDIGIIYRIYKKEILILVIERRNEKNL